MVLVKASSHWICYSLLHQHKVSEVGCEVMMLFISVLLMLMMFML